MKWLSSFERSDTQRNCPAACFVNLAVIAAAIATIPLISELHKIRED
jgi:hypothetical protein